MQKIEITFKNEQAQELERVAAEFEADEIQVLREYNTFGKELAECALFQSGTGAGVSLQISGRDGKIDVKATLPPWALVREFLIGMRPFILQRELTCFTRVRSLLGRRFESQLVRDWLRRVGSVYSGQDMQSQIGIFANQVNLLSEETLSLWLNADEYHRDRDKRESVRELESMLGRDGFRAVMLSLLIDKAKAVMALHAVVRIMVGASETGQVRVTI